MKISDTVKNGALVGMNYLCLLSYSLLWLYLVLASQAQFKWNAHPIKGAFPPNWCGTNIGFLLGIAFNVALPLQVLATVGLIVQCVRKKYPAPKMGHWLVILAITALSLGATGAWLYSSYFGDDHFGEEIWWM